MKYKTYPKMKDSGIEWIGDIPTDWNHIKLKYACKINPPKSEINNLPNDFKVSFLPMEKINEDGTLELEEEKEIHEVKDGFTYFRNDDIILAKITPCFENGKGSLCKNLQNGVGFGTTELHVLRHTSNFESLFVFYWTRSHPFMQTGESLMFGAAGQKRVPTEFIKDFVIVYPESNSTQTQIGIFLKNKIKKIDCEISKNHILIELLKRKKQATINHVVTKGLDPLIPMKDSGIKWVGDIPENWDIKRLKFTTKFDLSTVDRHEYDNEIHVSISHYPQVYNNEIISSRTELEKGTCNEKELKKFRLKKDDVLITKDSETQDDIGVPVYIQDHFENAVCGYHIAQLSTDKNQILGSFLFRFIQSDFVNAYFETEANGITRFGLGRDSINNLRIVLPSLLEQKQIINFLNTKTSKIDSEILKIQSLIKKIQKYRKSIVSSIITGKIDVR